MGRLPNLLIVGVPKSGTTSLFEYLVQHPEICGSAVKEPGYFTQFHPLHDPTQPAASLTWYEEQFSACRGERYALEATPSYSYGGQPVIDAIRRVLGSPKVVLSLRNPTERLWSAFVFQRAQGHLPGIDSFDQYLRIVQERHADGSDRSGTSRLQGLAIGFYGEFVPAWLEAFGDDLRIIYAEDLASRTGDVLEDLYRWLDLDPLAGEPPDLSRRNVSVQPRSSRLATIAFRAKTVTHLRVAPSVVRRPLRSIYRRLNTRSLSEQLGPDARRAIDAIYAESNAVTAQALREHGYVLPHWLDGNRAG